MEIHPSALQRKDSRQWEHATVTTSPKTSTAQPCTTTTTRSNSMIQKNTRSSTSDGSDELAQRQTRGRCHDQRDLDNTRETVENGGRRTHQGMDGEQQSMSRYSSTHPQEVEQAHRRSAALRIKAHGSDRRETDVQIADHLSSFHTRDIETNSCNKQPLS